MSEQRHPDLEAAIAANPDDPQLYLVYGDWLHAQGDPRGQLIAVQAALAKLPLGPFLATQERYPTRGREAWREPRSTPATKPLLDEQQRLLETLRPEPPELVDYMDSPYEVNRRAGRLDWHLGFVRRARFQLGGASLERIGPVVKTLAHPSCRFLRSLALGELLDDGYGKTALTRIAAVLPPTLRHLHVGDFDIGEPEISWVHVGDCSPLLRAAPRLETLIVQGASIAVETSALESLTRLRHLEIRTGGLAGETARAIAAARLAIETLILWFGRQEYGATTTLEDIAPILDGSSLPALHHLGLQNSEFDGLTDALAKARVIGQLRTLDLSMGCLTDDDARTLAAAAHRFTELTLDLSHNYLTDEGLPFVTGIAREVLTGDQRDPWDLDGEVVRYAAVGE